jgi:hypothetical protein
MNNELVKCANCEEILTQLEYRAMIDANDNEWCCYECVCCGEDGYTIYGKYKLLLKFVKEISNLTDCDLSIKAKKIIMSIKDDTND